MKEINLHLTPNHFDLNEDSLTSFCVEFNSVDLQGKFLQTLSLNDNYFQFYLFNDYQIKIEITGSPLSDFSIYVIVSFYFSTQIIKSFQGEITSIQDNKNILLNFSFKLNNFNIIKIEVANINHLIDSNFSSTSYQIVDSQSLIPTFTLENVLLEFTPSDFEKIFNTSTCFVNNILEIDQHEGTFPQVLALDKYNFQFHILNRNQIKIFLNIKPENNFFIFFKISFYFEDENIQSFGKEIKFEKGISKVLLNCPIELVNIVKVRIEISNFNSNSI
jgi:hypothetical protein